MRLTARVAFEERDRASADVFFEVDEDLADALSLRADAFAVGLMPLAAWAGERRLRVEGPLCPVLAANLHDHARVLAGWHARCVETRLEAAEAAEAAWPRTPARTGMFFSGGVDALATLRKNRLDLPPTHPASIRDGIFFFGATPRHLIDGEPDPERLRLWESECARLEAFGRTTGLELLPVRTNIIHVYEPESWRDAGFGAATVAIAHALAGRLTDVVFASGGAGAFLGPHGSHPLLDDRLTSAGLRVHSGLAYRTRLERVGLLVDWPEALASMRPCLQSLARTPNGTNCGGCEKCRRTMLALEAWGALDRAPAFAGYGLEADAIRRTRLHGGLETLYGEDLARALVARGREDLARAVREAMAAAGEGRWARRWRKFRRSIAKRLPPRS